MWHNLSSFIEKNQETPLKFYNLMALSVLLHGCETWIPVKIRLSWTQALDMRFLQSVKG